MQLGATAALHPGQDEVARFLQERTEIGPDVVFECAGARGTLHHHPEEQWGYCVSGSGTRYQADEAIGVSAGDFWRTPGNVLHTMQAGSEGLVVIDVFAPPREEYTKPGSGFGTATDEASTPASMLAPRFGRKA